MVMRKKERRRASAKVRRCEGVKGEENWKMLCLLGMVPPYVVYLGRFPGICQGDFGYRGKKRGRNHGDTGNTGKEKKGI